MIKFDGKKTGIFAAGVAFGTAGINIHRIRLADQVPFAEEVNYLPSG